MNVEIRRGGSAFFRGASAAALVLAAACSSSTGPKYPDLLSFCGGRAAAECSPAVVLACAAPSSSTCTSARQTVCTSSVPANSTYNAAAAEACVSEVSSAYSDAAVSLAESTAINAACVPVFDGPGAKDAACQGDSDCKLSAGLHCVLRAASNQGTCQVPTMVSGGGSCAAADAQCSTGFHCGPTANCDADGAMQAPCDPADPCGPGLMCSTGAICVAKNADGTACTSNDDCLNGICNEATGAASGLCVSQITLSPDEPFCVASR
jgi:hypothetical protein